MVDVWLDCVGLGWVVGVKSIWLYFVDRGWAIACFGGTVYIYGSDGVQGIWYRRVEKWWLYRVISFTKDPRVQSIEYCYARIQTLSRGVSSKAFAC